MSVVHERYKQLKPELHNYLADEAVLAQAWKKTHAYIRSHNWYADTLELDCSAVNLEKRIKVWAKQLKDGVYVPSEMRLVPAPKTDEWSFFKHDKDWIWGPKRKPADDSIDAKHFSKSKELRPLAHLNIQDQTVATAIMLCLADAVETAQGSTNPDDGHRVWSYGNRLFCNWEGDHAHFRWGNSSTYSKYFLDYQRFLERPAKKAQDKQRYLSPNESIYEIHLDIEAFYDSINRNQLISILKKLAERYYDTDSMQSEAFWETVKNTFQSWRWSKADEQLAGCFKNGLSSRKGLPQGLVASELFANAYLLDLDKVFSGLIGEVIEHVTLIDYCRYVDDIRLLVHTPNDSRHDWKVWVKTNIQQRVGKATKGLVLNLDKTKVERYTSKKSGISVRMKAIQEAASGPQDGAALDEMLGSLEGLFALAEQFRDHDELSYRDCNLSLAWVDQPQMDVREDTILRFSANRVTKALSDKRLLSVQDETDNENLSELDHVCEAFARRFVSIWSRNPSLVSILKKGFCLFPHPKLLQPVCERLLNKLSPCGNDINHERERRIAYYCLAEIFRFAALELRCQRPEGRPTHSDSEGFCNILYSTARHLLDEGGLPWYVQQQIALFMAIFGKPVYLPPKGELMDDYRLLHRMLQGSRRFSAKDAVERWVPLFIVAYQVSPINSQVVATLGDWLDWLQHNEHQEHVSPVLHALALNNPALFQKLLRLSRQIPADWRFDADVLCNQFGLNHVALPGKMSDYDNVYVSLASIVTRKDNPFAHENALLTLADKLLNKKDFLCGEKQLMPHNLEIWCKSWGKVQCVDNIESLFKLRWTNKTVADHRYNLPDWLSNGEESIQLYRLGCFLRACAIGKTDFTAGQYLMREDTISAYFGLKSTWYKRRMGMAHQPEALNGEVAPMSSWVSELLYRLLQWPGLDVRAHTDEWQGDLTFDAVKKSIRKRIHIQAAYYGSATNLPVYIEKINYENRDGKHLRVVMVQTLLPQKEDFTKEGPELNGKDFRAKHRSHVATMSKLVYEQLSAERHASGAKVNKPIADLIVFPELAVHEEDIALLKRLADKTGAMIFTGIVYQQKGDDLINTALWLIPIKNGHGRQWIKRFQGKFHVTRAEKRLRIKPWRPYQLVIELSGTLKGQSHGFRLSGAICYDATDISLAADLKDVTNVFIVSALNQDTDTFDSMVDALHYHMFQPVVLVNTGEFGGSVAKAPYKEKYHKQIAHAHGSNQIAISMFELNMYDFGEKSAAMSSGKEMKTEPAGLKRANK